MDLGAALVAVKAACGADLDSCAELPAGGYRFDAALSRPAPLAGSEAAIVLDAEEAAAVDKELATDGAYGGVVALAAEYGGVAAVEGLELEAPAEYDGALAWLAVPVLD